ncbi:uncharacterized protein LOC125191922 [Salvia hispanica]|uniref:uncharacterized protein LOC125191922 n=1 Tax=Salvia hispanica TaxID=49212 RepID=UPI0020094F0B|nr:uncharacterized protein LOC125191922 [Salvia hispanica]
MAKYCAHNTSNYSWSIDWIELIQTFGVIVGVVACGCRVINDGPFKAARASTSFRDAFKLNKHWTLKLVEWRDTPLPFRVQNRVCKKLLYDIVRFVLNFCIGVQILFVSAAKPAQILSVSHEKLCQVLRAKFGSTTLFRFCKKIFRVGGSETSRYAAQVDFKQYVLLLEGEPKLPYIMLKSICMEADRLIQQGKNKQPTNLIRLLRKSANFNGVERFDSNQVPSLHSHEPPNCWSLPVVTLMTILVALTDIADDEANQLLASVAEGLSIVKLIEKTLDRNAELESIVKAADVVWIGVEVYRKWNDKDLDSTSVRGATLMETLQNLSNIAEKIVTEFMAQTRDVLMQDPLNWPARVIAANSMYRIVQMIMVRMTNGEHQSDAELFESVSITIADIISACLTNLVRVITLKCQGNDYMERHKGVSRAAILLGESTDILDILQQREVPSLDVEKAGILMSGGHP